LLLDLSIFKENGKYVISYFLPGSYSRNGSKPLKPGEKVIIPWAEVELENIQKLRSSEKQSQAEVSPIYLYANDIDYNLNLKELQSLNKTFGYSIKRINDPTKFLKSKRRIILGGHKAYTDGNMPKNLAGLALTPSEESKLESERDFIVVHLYGTKDRFIIIIAGSDRNDNKVGVEKNLYRLLVEKNLYRLLREIYGD